MSPKADFNIHDIRRNVLKVCSATGHIAEVIATVPLLERGDLFTSYSRDVIGCTINIAVAAGINLFQATEEKLKLNNNKYPVKCCQDNVRILSAFAIKLDFNLHVSLIIPLQIEKYTAFSKHTGITRKNQSIFQQVDICHENVWVPSFRTLGLAKIAEQSIAFVAARNWEQHDTTTSLALALCSEAGELADVVAWTTNLESHNDLIRIQDLIAQELADITILLVRFAKKYDIKLL